MKPNRDWLLLIGGVLMVAAIAAGVVWSLETAGTGVCDRCERASAQWPWLTIGLLMAGVLALGAAAAPWTRDGR
jgi:hypothetical protein